MSETEIPPIGRNEMAALGEIVRRQSSGLDRCRPYWWRKSSMRKLEAHGLVRRHPANPGTDAQPAWLVTEAGIAEWHKGQDQ